MSSASFFKVVAKNFDVLAGPVITLVYPLYASIKAIETKSPVDDQQWLTYWVLYSLITLFELTFAKMIEWLPFWPYVKLIFTCWLVLPYFSGAAYVYEHYVRTLFVNQQLVNIWYVPRNNNISSNPDDILSAAERYIEANGPEAFEKLINKGLSLADTPLKLTKVVDMFVSSAGNPLAAENATIRIVFLHMKLNPNFQFSDVIFTAERVSKSRSSKPTYDDTKYATWTDNYSIHDDPRWN